MKRRGMLKLGAGVLALGAAGGAYRFVATTHHRSVAAACRAALAESFPKDILRKPAARAFLKRYVSFSEAAGGTYPPEDAYIHFLTSTNVIAHIETGEELDFNDIYDAQRTPCGNRLSALHAPAGEHDL
ncbi:MAG: hypothetical protein ACU0CY_13475 [Maritimibacter harenae]